MVPPGDLDRVELDRAEPVEHREDAAGPGRERPRRREEVVEDEVAASDLTGDCLPGHSRRRYSGATRMPPQSLGSTSASVSLNVHRWPAGSSASYWRSPYGKSVGSITIRAPLLRARSQ